MKRHFFASLMLMNRQPDGVRENPGFNLETIMDCEVVIGLEVHVQLNTKSKAFCGCSAEFGREPNTLTCPVCLGLPGSLPVLNRRAFELAVKVGIVLDCKIAEIAKFDRKNYFYPDMPKNYQISQYSQPISYDGYIDIAIDDSILPAGQAGKRVRIRRAHLEEDTGKLLHEGITGGSLVDFNRSGIPLLEIVSEPDIRSPQEAYAYLTSLKSILKYIDVSDCNMEEGSLRCDANISVRHKGTSDLGTKVEIKNMNSFKAVKQALEFESNRQLQMLNEKENIIQETRLWDDEKRLTLSMRTKEEAHDYRYFPEPDLVPFHIEEKLIQVLKGHLVELPRIRLERLVREYQLSEYDARILTSDKLLADYFEETLKFYNKPKILSNWLITEVLGYLNAKGMDVERLSLKSEYLARLLNMIEDGTISGKIAKEVLPLMLETDRSPEEIVKGENLVQILDTTELEGLAKDVIRDNPGSVDDFLSGKENALMFLVGQAMRLTKGRANPQRITRILREKIEGMKRSDREV